MSDHTMDEQYVAELLARLAAARKARARAESERADMTTALAELHQVFVDLVGEDALDAEELVTKAKAKIQQLQNDRDAAESFGWQVAALLQAMAPHSDTGNRVTAAMEAWQLQKDQLETMSPILYRLNQAAAAAVGLSEHAPEGEILGRLAELRQILHDLVEEGALGSGGLLAAAKVKIQKLQDDQKAAEALDLELRSLQHEVANALQLTCVVKGPGLNTAEWPLGDKLETLGILLRRMIPTPMSKDLPAEALDRWEQVNIGLKTIADLSKAAGKAAEAADLLRVMVPYETEDRVVAALEAWKAAGRRSALFQKTGQELGLTDSASPEQILQRAQEVAMILRSRSQAQDFDANMLAMLGLPANTSRDAVLDAVKKLVAFRDGRATIDDFAKHPLLSLSELPVGTKCVAAATIRASNKRTAFCACTPFTVKEIAPDKSSVFISHDRREVGFWVDSAQPAVLTSAIKRPSDDSARDLALLQDKITYELGLLSPQLPDCREGLNKAGSLLRLLAQPSRDATLVDLAHAKVKEMTRPRHPGSSFARVHPALFGDLLMALDLPIGTSAEELVAAVKTLRSAPKSNE